MFLMALAGITGNNREQEVSLRHHDRGIRRSEEKTSSSSHNDDDDASGFDGLFFFLWTQTDTYLLTLTKSVSLKGKE